MTNSTRPMDEANSHRFTSSGIIGERQRRVLELIAEVDRENMK